jgi:hypothetical protein
MKIYGQLEKAQLENLASDPATAAEGMVYYNTTTSTPRIYKGGSWSDLSGTSAASLPSIITANSADPALRITQTGTGDALVVEDSANPDATPFKVASNGDAFFGANALITNGSLYVNSTTPSAGSQFNFGDQAGSFSNISLTHNGAPNPMLVIEGYSNSGTLSNQMIKFEDLDSGQTSYLWNDTARESLRIITGSGQQIALDSAGTVVSANSAIPALRITQTGTGDALRVEDATNDTTPFVIDSAGNVTIGSYPSTANSLTVHGVGTLYAGAVITNTAFNSSVGIGGGGILGDYGSYISFSDAGNGSAVISYIGDNAGDPAPEGFNRYELKIATQDSAGTVRIASPTVVEANNTAPALRITQTGTGDALRVEDSANPDATPFRIDHLGRVSSSGTISSPVLGASEQIYIDGAGADAEPYLRITNDAGNQVQLRTTEYSTTLETYDEFKIVSWDSNVELLKLSYGAGAVFSGSITVGDFSGGSVFIPGGGVSTAIVNSGSNFTLNQGHSAVGLTATSGTQTATLPTAVGITGRIYTIKRRANGATSYTVAAQAGQKIDGAATYALTALNSFVTVQSDGANWWVIGKG